MFRIANQSSVNRKKKRKKDTNYALRSLEFTQVKDPGSLPQRQWLVEHEVGTDDSIHICIHSNLNEALMRE